MVVSLTLNHRRKPTVGRADPPVVPVTDEISPNKNSQLIRGQAFRIVAVIEKLAFHSGPHAFTSSIIVHLPPSLFMLCIMPYLESA